MTSPIHRSTDRSFLQQQAYADSTKLRARASIYAYRDPPGPIGPWVLGLVDWPEGTVEAHEFGNAASGEASPVP